MIELYNIHLCKMIYVNPFHISVITDSYDHETHNQDERCQITMIYGETYSVRINCKELNKQIALERARR